MVPCSLSGEKLCVLTEESLWCKTKQLSNIKRIWKKKGSCKDGNKHKNLASAPSFSSSPAAAGSWTDRLGRTFINYSWGAELWKKIVAINGTEWCWCWNVVPNIKMPKCVLKWTVDCERKAMSTFPLISCVYLQHETLFWYDDAHCKAMEPIIIGTQTATGTQAHFFGSRPAPRRQLPARREGTVSRWSAPAHRGILWLMSLRDIFSLPAFCSSICTRFLARARSTPDQRGWNAGSWQ